MSDTAKFRSVLPHEPLPTNDPRGYLHLQGSFEPRHGESQHNKQKDGTSKGEEAASSWDATTLEQALTNGIRNLSFLSGIRVKVLAVEVMDKHPPFTKARLILTTQKLAQLTMALLRSHQVSPADVLGLYNPPCGDHQFQFSTRQLQVTQITASPLPSPEISWPRSNPPKFRRLLARPRDDPVLLAKERSQARFVFVSGLLEKPDAPPACWSEPHTVMDAVRRVANMHDSSGLGVEVFVSNKKAALYCHVGMRSPADAKSLVGSLQGGHVQWSVVSQDETGIESFVSVPSGKLFLDFVDITHRSHERGNRSNVHGCEVEKGEVTRSECTSTTASVVVPGLALIPDFVSVEEEEVLMAVLVGPNAPWAPLQTTPSNYTVKRRVQHYGYVFDYETANVLRDRSEDKANCPAMPAIPQPVSEISTLETFVASSVKERRGFELLAGVVERVRRHDFAPSIRQSSLEPTPTTLMFPDLNQLTVNEYKEGAGIGSHIDTPSAFGDGLISISLNSGIVMEFRRPSSSTDEKGWHRSKKLVYLPPRSLLLMSGPARYEWEHHIVTRKTDTHNGTVLSRGRRVSLTLRTALDVAARGSRVMPLVESGIFPPRWGSGRADGHGKQSSLTTPSTERDHVHAVYNAIATQWHHTRGKRGVLWPGATQFLQRLPPGSVVADVGCGDGKYFPAIWEAGSYVIGTDISEPLLRMSIGQSTNDQTPESRRVSANRNHLRARPAVAVADCMQLPLRSKSCDAAICVAVMHHLSTEERRIRCIEELERIVRIGGTINIQAWAMEQQEGSRRIFHANDVFVPFNAQPKYLDRAYVANTEPNIRYGNKSVAEMYSDAYDGAEFDEKKGLVVFQRYCHLYREGEMEGLASRVPGVELIQSGYESGNYFIILKVVAH